MAGAGAKTWSTGDVLTASDVNTYLMQQSIMVFATETTRDAALTSPSDGMFAYTTTTPADTLSYYNGSAWVAVDLAGDITGITTAANSSMAGGATSGAPSLTVDVNNSTSVTAVAADYVLIADTSDSNATKRALVSDITALVPQGDLTGLTAGTNIDITSATGPVPTITLAIDAALATGVDGTGVDVTFHSDTAGDYALWDSSEEKLILEGTNGATVLDVTDGNVVIGDGTLTVGSDGAGEDVTFHSDTAGDAFAWDSSAEKLTITGTDGQTALDVPDGNVTITDTLTVSGGLVAPLAINAQTGTTYTFVLADAGKFVSSSNGSAQTFTVPPNSSVAYATGTQIIVQNIGSANCTLAEGSGVTINSKDSNKEIDGQYAAATLIKTATDAWSLIGALA